MASETTRRQILEMLPLIPAAVLAQVASAQVVAPAIAPQLQLSQPGLWTQDDLDTINQQVQSDTYNSMNTYMPSQLDPAPYSGPTISAQENDWEPEGVSPDEDPRNEYNAMIEQMQINNESEAAY
jgi:hypothetical protein